MRTPTSCMNASRPFIPNRLLSFPEKVAFRCNKLEGKTLGSALVKYIWNIPTGMI